MTKEEWVSVENRVSVAHQILLVEDDASSAESMKSVLESEGYHVTVAKDGGQAQSSLVMRKPDFVILDLMLPGESGFEVCQRFKQTEENIPILVVTAIELDDSRQLAERVGADGYLSKPVDPVELLEKVATISQQNWERTHLHRTRSGEKMKFRCRCGKKFRVSPQHKGKTLTCPDCGEPLIVPRHS